MLGHYSDHYVLPLPAGHRFPMAKYRLLRDEIARTLPGVRLVEAPSADDETLCTVHAPAYVRAVAEGRLDPAAQREIGFPWSAAMVERSRRSVGATVAAAQAALREGVAGNLAGGTHHAMADRGSGYCVFNDQAVAIRTLQAGDGGLRMAVVDLDVHQGNGTAAIFAGDPGVFTLSLHGAKNFPFRKERSDLDVELPDGCADAQYLDALDDALDALWRRFGRPDLVFYLAGADPHERDRLGRLKLSAAGLAERDRRVFAACRARRISVVLTMGGGYGHAIEETVAVQLATWRAAYACWQEWQAPGSPGAAALP